MLEYFRHQIIKKVIAGFGSLFNDIHVAKYDSDGAEVERYKVPIAYGPKQKFITRIESENEDLVRSFAMLRPRMGYEMTNIVYDATRKTTTTRKSAKYTTNDGTLETRFERVPYNLTFFVHVVTKNTEEAFQILEQILPYFGPDFCITFKTFPIDQQADVPITIGDVNFTENYEGNFEERKNFTISIMFTAKINLYGPVTTSKVITDADINFMDLDSYTVSGTTASADGHYYSYYGVTGGTFATVTVGATAGATAGSIGQTGNIYTIIREYPD